MRSPARLARSSAPSVALALATLVACVPPLDRPVPGDRGPPPPDLLPPLYDGPKPGSEPGGSCASLVCELGCDELLGRCRRLRAVNVDAAPVFAAALETLTLSGAATIDTDSGEIKDGATTIRAAGSEGSAVGGVYFASVAQGSGAKLALFGVKRFELKAGATVTIVGKQAFLLYATEAATIAGTLVAPAKAAQGGPGGFDGGPNNAAAGAACGGGEGKGGGWGNGGSTGDGGGGGGGFKASGGAGGDSDYPPTPAGGAGGASNGEASLSPLRGGCGGGAGGGPGQGPGGYGGGGGGAIQLCVNGTLEVTGAISAPGAGGEGAHEGAAGGGGGSGGAVLLQALKLTLGPASVLAANGGGGGSGAYGPGQTGALGEGGQASATPAKGGVGGGAYGGAGGAGGAGADETGKPGAKEANGGGGGGGVGRLAIVAKASTLAGVNSPADVSKSATVEGF
jgi:hypothetical protein